MIIFSLFCCNINILKIYHRYLKTLLFSNRVANILNTFTIWTLWHCIESFVLLQLWIQRGKRIFELAFPGILPDCGSILCNYNDPLLGNMVLRSYTKQQSQDNTSETDRSKIQPSSFQAFLVCACLCCAVWWKCCGRHVDINWRTSIGSSICRSGSLCYWWNIKWSCIFFHSENIIILHFLY